MSPKDGEKDTISSKWNSLILGPSLLQCFMFLIKTLTKEGQKRQWELYELGTL